MVGNQHRPSSSPPRSPPGMDSRVWSQLPEHLLDVVLSFLPLKTFLNLICTCKHFKALISSPQFLSKHADSSNFSSFLLLSHPQFNHQCPLYDTNRGTWRKVALPLPPSLSSAPLLSVSRGLLCFSLPHSASFVVSDLLSRSSKVVNFPIHSSTFDMVTLISSPVGFRIFLLCSSPGSSNTAFVYGSRSDQWQKFDPIESILGNNYHQEGIPFNNFLYFITPAPFSIISFDLENGKWGTLPIPLHVELTFARLVSDGDKKLYLIGGIGQHGISRGIRIWELREMGTGWVEIESLPDLICRKFMSICYHIYEHVYCFWHEGMICVCCYNWPEILYYKVSRRTWHWLPKNPALPDKWTFGFRWFSLVPELNASVLVNDASCPSTQTREVDSTQLFDCTV